MQQCQTKETIQQNKNQQIQCSELQYCMSKGIHAHTDEMAYVVLTQSVTKDDNKFHH